MTVGFWARLVPVALVALVLQAALFDQVVVVGAHPDCFVVLAAASGAVLGPARGAVVSFFLGLLADLIVATPFGLSSLAFALLAFGVGMLPSLGSAEGRHRVDFAVCVVAAAVGTGLYAAIGALVNQPAMLSTATVDAELVVTLGAVVIAMPALWAMRFVARGLAVPALSPVPPGGSALQ